VQNDPTLGYTLIPDVTKVRAAADAIFADQVAGPSPEEVQRQTVQAEAARIVLLNGTEEKGLASKMQAKLVTQGFNVTTVGNADRADYVKSQLVIYGEPKQATVDALMTWFGISEDRVSTEPAAEDKDIAVIVGSDQSETTAKVTK
jgi:hypothetical protein